MEAAVMPNVILSGVGAGEIPAHRRAKTQRTAAHLMGSGLAAWLPSGLASPFSEARRERRVLRLGPLVPSSCTSPLPLRARSLSAAIAARS